MQRDPDEKILELLNARNNQNEGVKLFLKVYGKGLYGFIMTFLHNSSDADDIFQEVLIRLVKKSGSFKGQSGLKTWVWQIAKNQCIDFLRKKKRTLKKVDSDADWNRITAFEEPYFNGDETLKRLHAEVAKLPDVQKSVFILRYFEALNYREIAEITKKTESNLKTSFHLAAKKVARGLKNHL